MPSTLNAGLEGVAIAETKISSIDGAKGRLIYRGHLIEEVADKHTFEEVVYLLWYGDFPDKEQLTEFNKQLVAQRELPDYVKKIIETLPKNIDVMSMLRTAVSSLTVPGASWPPTKEQAIQILAKAPTMVAYFYNLCEGKAEIKPNASLGHVENYLYMLTGKKPDESHARALETYLMISADHDMNASTFTARVVTSTESDIVSAVTAAIGALKGPLHGGAPSEVDNMLDDIGSKENAEKWLRNRIENHEKIMGFGHRVYKAYDPRARALKEIVKKFSNKSHYFDLSLYVEDLTIKLLEEYKPGRNLFPNLEFWASGVLREIGLPRELYTPTFCISRIAGWSAQCMEQSEHNRIMRPSSIYVGKQPK